MNKAGICHFANSNYSFPVRENMLKIRLRAERGDLKRVIVVYGTRFPEDGADPVFQKELKLLERNNEFDYFAATIKIKDGRFRYQFFLDDGDESYWFNEKGFFKKRPTGYRAGFFHFPYIGPGNLFKAPSWVRDSIFYQIFPERYFNGNSDIDHEKKSPWGGKPEHKSFFGGDLEGIIQKLDYIEQLGINALYLTPIFQSPTNHKYDVVDYMQVDPHFGDIGVAKKLVRKAHKRGIKVMLDAVFNHCGFNFFAFKDVRNKGERSPYVDWFFIDSFPIETEPANYKTFATNVFGMPKLNTDNPEVQSYLLKVVEYWMKELDIDGWRLDVANEVSSTFWRRFREKVKSIKSDAYIVGEIWHNSQNWLRGDQFDAVMNYRFSQSVIDFFAREGTTPGIFNTLLSENRMAYHDTVNYAMINLLDSHDTPRILDLFQGNKEKMKLAVLFQMTYIGAPMLYYGDEIGLGGGDDPDNRRCMIWEKDEWDRGLFSYYKDLISLRKKLEPLRRGGFKSLVIDDLNNVFGFKRVYRDREILILLNNSSKKSTVVLDSDSISSDDPLQDYLTENIYELEPDLEGYKVTILPYQGLILE